MSKDQGYAITEKEKETEAASEGPFRRWVLVIGRVPTSVAGFTIFLMMFLVVLNIATRRLANWPIPGAMPVASAMLVVVVFLSLAHGEEKRAHVRVELLTDRLSPKGRNISDLFVFGLGFLFLAMFTWASGLAAMGSFARDEFDQGSLHLRLYPFRFIVAIGLGVFALKILVEAVSALRRLSRKGRN